MENEELSRAEAERRVDEGREAIVQSFVGSFARQQIISTFVENHPDTNSWQ